MAKKKKRVVKKASKKATKSKVSKKKKTVSKKKKKTVSRKSSAKKEVSTSSVQRVDRVAKKVKKARTKSDILSVLSESTGLAKKEVSLVVEKLGELICHDVGKKGPGVFNLSGLVKVLKVHKPATKSRPGINPFTKEPMVFKAKPARNIVRVRALKGLKESV